MADKRISQLVERTDIANNDVVPIVASGATTTNKATISSIQTFMQENLDVGVTSVGITLGSAGTDVNVTGSPITTSGNITINIPDASATARGLVNTSAQTFAGAKTFVSDIIANGVNVGKGAGTGVDNVRVGANTLIANTTGTNNTAVGARSLQTNSTGQNNTAIGLNSLQSNSTGINNTSVGLGSLNFNTSGSNNVAIGADAGRLTSTSSTLLIANNSVFIGRDTRANASNETNQIVIGNSAIGQGSNTVTIGNSSITSNKFFGRIIHADAVNADESATLGQVNTTLGGFVTLGTAQTITAQKVFTTSGGTDSVIISHGSGSGIALDVIKAGSGQAIRVQKTSGGGDAVTITGGRLLAENGTFTGQLSTLTGGHTITLTSNLNGATNRIESSARPLEIVTAGSAITLAAGGTTPQITLASSGAVTLTGALNGTSASFNTTNAITLTASDSRVRGGDTTGRLLLANSGTTTFGIFYGSSHATLPNVIQFVNDNSPSLTLASTGAATFSSSVTANGVAFLGQVPTYGSDFAQFSHSSRAGADQYSFLSNNGGATFINSVNAQPINFRHNNVDLAIITSAGNVGIGTASPTRRLQVESSPSGGIEVGRFVNNSNSEINDFVLVSILGSNGNSTSSFHYIAATGAADKLYIFGNGNVVNTNNSYGSLSDAKLKENIEDATPKLDDLMKVKVRNYNLIGDDKKQIGVIAQELEGVFPAMIDESEDFEEVEVPQLDEEGNEVLNEEGEVVTEKQRVSKGTTTKSVKYSVFVPMLIKAIQELKTEIDSLKNQIK